MPNAMSRLSRKRNKEDLDLNDEDILTLDVQNIYNSNGEQDIFLGEASTPVPTEAEMIEAQSEGPYCQNVRSVKGAYPTYLFNHNRLLCRE